MKKLFVLLFITTISFAQNANRHFVSLENDENFYKIEVTDGVYRLRFLSSSIIETNFIPEGEAYNPKSAAVVLNTVKNPVPEINNQDKIVFTLKELSVEIIKSPFQIIYRYKGNEILSEKAGYVKRKHIPLDYVQGNIIADSTQVLQFNISDSEVLYGGGARALGMNRRGNKLALYNRAHYGYETHSELMNYTMPVVLSSNKYMIHFDNPVIGYLDLDSKNNNTLEYETISGRKTYQVIVGNSWLDMLDNYTGLTGKQPMPPRWALGNFSSRFGYHSQYETEATIDAFNKEEIPVDAIILDLYWFGKEVQGTMGNLEIDRDSFPDFEGMVSRLKDKGVKTVLITEPFILTTSKRWQEAVDKDILAKDSLGNPFTYDFYFGNTGLIDIYKPEAEQWFWNIYKDLANKGVAGVWGDLGEPEVHPSKLRHATGTAGEVHNIYGHDWARLVFEGYERDFPETRPFILMRAGYSGSQRYGLIPWSGDVNRTWGGLQSQPEIALQMGMQGLAYMHSDLGGFAGDNLDDELYVRWLQYGVFQPIFRPHAQEDVPSEPVFRSDKAKSLAKQAIELRYKLLPYNYNLAFKNHKEGKPLMRPLFFEEDDNQQLFNYSKAYLWGNDILVSPVLEAGKTSQDVYFPKGSKWFDFYSDDVFEGGKMHTVSLNEATIPTFVRAGAFIPMANPMQNTTEYNADTFELHYYFDTSVKKSERDFYNDNGLNPNAYENNAFEILKFESELKKNRLQIEFEVNIEENYTSKAKQLQLIIHNIQKQPKWIKINGKKLNVSWNSTNKTLDVPLNWNPSETIEIKIELKK